ncbi:hypothetical protein [Legionella tunisiensis]|uniref:hypothetical protein n=1 Tax=Legionella tunisiensis TaxID=1034944 RepID=UPI001E33A7EA|nr:hypothetical protein [Legionella tunisiensis]
MPVFAKSVSSANKLIEYLVQEKINLTLAINNVKLTELPTSLADYEKLRQENERLIALNQAKLLSLESFLVNQKNCNRILFSI